MMKRFLHWDMQIVPKIFKMWFELMRTQKMHYYGNSSWKLSILNVCSKKVWKTVCGCTGLTLFYLFCILFTKWVHRFLSWRNIMMLEFFVRLITLFFHFELNSLQKSQVVAKKKRVNRVATKARNNREIVTVIVLKNWKKRLKSGEMIYKRKKDWLMRNAKYWLQNFVLKRYIYKTIFNMTVQLFNPLHLWMIRAV